MWICDKITVSSQGAPFADAHFVTALFAAISGISITRFGYFTAFIAGGSAIFTAGAGLIYTLDIGTPAAKYLGYQVILGLGQGLAIQIPVITGQAFSETADIAATTATVLCKCNLRHHCYSRTSWLTRMPKK